MWRDLNLIECLVLLYQIFIGVLLYVIVYKFNFFINGIIVSTINIITGLLLSSGMAIGERFLLIIGIIVISFVWVYIASRFRDAFEYETIVIYIFISGIVPLLLFALFLNFFE